MRNNVNQQKHFILGIFLAVAIFSGFSGQCQEKEEKIIADETTGQEMKTVYKITTDNYFIPLEIIKTYGSKARSYIVRNKKDRQGDYAQYIFYFPIELKDDLEAFVSQLKRPETAKSK